MKYLLILAILFASCSVAKKESSSVTSSAISQNNIETIASRYPDWQCQEKGGYLVFQKKNTPTRMNPAKIIHVVVVDTVSAKEIFNEEIINGSFEWVDEFIFKVNYTPGNPELGKDYFYYFNMKTKKKTRSISPNKA